jgi:tRNA (guanine37-N1)-methyltransferase
MNLYTALVHYPVYDKNRRLVATAVTNIDVHDIARASATFGVNGYFIVTPVVQQRELVGELLEHWTDGPGAKYNPRRQEALARARVVPDLAEATRLIAAETGHEPITIGTGANVKDRMVSFQQMRTLLKVREGSALLVFGTGWGLEKAFLDAFDYVLAPVLGPVEYNHLSVRSAAAIVMDRLCGLQNPEDNLNSIEQ